MVEGFGASGGGAQSVSRHSSKGTSAVVEESGEAWGGGLEGEVEMVECEAILCGQVLEDLGSGGVVGGAEF